MVNLIFYKGKNPKKKNLIKNQSCSVNILKIKITMQSKLKKNIFKFNIVKHLKGVQNHPKMARYMVYK